MRLMQELRKRPDAIWLLPITMITAFSQLLVITDCMFKILPIAEEAALQIMATGAEIIAGLYGLTLTGYIFFMDYLQEQIRDNELVSEVVMILRKRYYKVICYISVQTVAAIIMAIILNFYDLESNCLPLGILRFLVNETLFLMICVVFAIIYFVLDIVNPDKIASVSLKHKERLEEEEEEIEKVIPVDVEVEGSNNKKSKRNWNWNWKCRAKSEIHKKRETKTQVSYEKAKEEKGDLQGDLQGFLQDYQEIEEILKKSCIGLAGNALRKNPFNPVALREAALMGNGQNPMLFAKLTRLHQYYCYMMFSNEQTVSKRMCDLAKEIKTELLQMQKAE